MTDDKRDDGAERRESDRRQGERRKLGWRHKWQGPVALIGAIGTLAVPTYDFLRERARLEYQFQLDIKKAEIELLKQQLQQQGEK